MVILLIDIVTGFNKIPHMHCGHGFVSATNPITTTLTHAKLQCLYDNNCHKVFDSNCDDKPPFQLCTKGQGKQSNQGACIHVKTDKGHSGNYLVLTHIIILYIYIL